MNWRPAALWLGCAEMKSLKIEWNCRQDVTDRATPPKVTKAYLDNLNARWAARRAAIVAQALAE